MSANDVTARRLGTWSVSVVLGAFAVLLLLDPLRFASPVAAPDSVPDWATDPTPVRRPSESPEYRVGVFRYGCSDCHRIIPSASEGRELPIQHTEIRLEHGINTRCLNCHHPTNRDAFVADSGAEIPWNQPQLLCAKCHGPVYRDWQHGAHGRTNGYWDTSRGEQTRRRCIECHDPHKPPFPSMVAAPGPDTLRMGRQQVGDHAGQDNPLRVLRHPRVDGAYPRIDGAEDVLKEGP
ncbi:MAG: hypothetical protein FJ276_05975 [Planctomycetes bacterium]|nr:hypothetical protein [Planctomycetota bacterium]